MAHTTFPSDLPVPEDDGAVDHVKGSAIPSVSLPATSGDTVDLSALKGLTILFLYPRTGAPGETVPQSWDAIPGARGCTPQACSFRDSSDKLSGLGVKNIFGISTNSSEYQKEAKARLHLPYDLLSDRDLRLVEALRLPTFEWEGNTLVKRMAFALEDSTIVKVWYPVFPPDRNAGDIVEWLQTEHQT